MSYISDLRKYVGHEPIIGIGATVLIINKNNEILLNLRSDTNTWGIPGGTMELFENIEDVAKREVLEETGLKVNKLELLSVLSGKDYYFIYPNGDKLCTIIVLYKCKDYSGKLKINDDESIELKFFDLNNLPIMESRAYNIFKKIKKDEIKLF